MTVVTIDSGAIRYSPGGGVLAVANDVVAFVAPPGRTAGEEFCELALSPASDAELDALTPADFPPAPTWHSSRFATTALPCSPSRAARR